MTRAEPSLRITKLTIIEWLRDIDTRTGKNLATTLARELPLQGTPIEVEYFRISTKTELNALIDDLEAQVLRGEHSPMLHFECHGHTESGLEFDDGNSWLSWAELADLLRPLNRALRCSLFLGMAACNGFDAIQQFDFSKSSYCAALVGPTDSVWSSELEFAFTPFYLALLQRGKSADAVSAILDFKLEHGAILLVTAQQWFITIATGYVKNASKPHVRREMALRRQRLLAIEGVNVTRKTLKQQDPAVTTRHLQHCLVTFFLMREFPENWDRYRRAGEALAAVLEENGFPTKWLA